jgi:hypothetical protein
MIHDPLDLKGADARTVVWTNGDVLRVAGHLAPMLHTSGWAEPDPSLPGFAPAR